MSKVRRSVGFAITVLLSLALPLGVIAWSVDSFFKSDIEPFDFAILKNGEIWYSEYHPTHGIWPWSEENYSNRLKCVNPSTGIERSIELNLEDGFVTPLWFGDELFLVSASAIYKLTEETKFKSTKSPMNLVAHLPSTGFASWDRVVFFYDGELTTVAEDDFGNCRLMHLRNNQFVEGRKIRRPPDHCTWYDNPTDGRKMFQPAQPSMITGIASPSPVPQYATYGQATFATAVPLVASPSMVVASSATPTLLTYSSPAAASLTMWSLQVQQDGDHVHVLYVTNDNFCAYREGLDFDDETQEGVSALNAENVIRDANGWQPIPNIAGGHFAQNMICDRNGVLFSLTNGEMVRKSPGGDWSNVSGAANFDFEFSPRLIVDSSGGTVYLVGKSGNVLRIEGNSVQPTELKVPDRYSVYIARWRNLATGVIGAVLLHYLIVAAGTMLLMRSLITSQYEFGVQKVTLASPGRRGLALSIDLVIITAALLFSVWAHLRFLGMDIGFSTRQEFVEWLMLVYQTVEFGSSQRLTYLQYTIQELASSFLFDPEDGTLSPKLTVFIAVLIDTGLVVWLLKVYDEGRFGWTPGKWLLGIRTVRTTLRKCGLARAMVRDVLYWIDLLGFLTPLPAAASIVFSSNRQRWGDRIADTIVIKRGSEEPRSLP